MGVDTSPEAGWLHNKGLRVIGGGVRLELDWPDLASFPNYGLVRTRLDFDDLLAQRAVEAGADAAHRRERHRPGARRATAGWSASGRGRPGQGARPPSAPRWWSPPTASPAGSRSPSAWPSGRTGRSAWPSGATTARRPSTTTTTWSPGWSCAARTAATSCCPGYGWIFGLGDGRVNVGLGVLNSSSRVRQDQLPAAAHRLAGQHARPTGA